MTIIRIMGSKILLWALEGKGGPSNVAMGTVKGFLMLTVEFWSVSRTPIQHPLGRLRNVCRRLFG